MGGSGTTGAAGAGNAGTAGSGSPGTAGTGSPGTAGTGNPGTAGSGNGTGGGSGSGAGGGSTGAAGAAARGGAGGTGVAGSAGAQGGRGGGVAGTTGGGGHPMGGVTPGLAMKFADYFPIGAAVDSQSYTTHASVLKAHFNSVTAENEMKWVSLEATEGSFSYGSADAIVNFATSNKMKVRGHTFVWHTQNPSWLFTNSSGGMATKEVLLARMKKHITNVAQHFKGKIYAWDVVNEAIMEDGSYRNGTLADDKKSLWYQIMGESYIAEAFKAAHAADPDAKLFYNDFYDYIPAKQQAIYNMLKELLAQGVPIHGVGMQCHLNIQPSTNPSNQGYYQDVGHLEDAIKLYSSLGLEVQVTELDLSLYVPGVTYTSDMFYTSSTFTTALKNQQADRYAAFFALFRAYRSVITGVTFWGIADDNTWLSEFSSGRKDFPLLFDNSHNPKPSFWAVVDF